MREQLVAAFKSALRPIVKHRFLIERAKYAGTTILDGQAGNDLVGKLLLDAQPMAAGKMGASELGGLAHYERNKDAQGKCSDWGRHAPRLNINAGVYPADPEIFARFCRDFGVSLGLLDVLAVWFQFGENQMRRKFAPQAKAVELGSLEPYYHQNPWSKYLAGKRVLVVTPFASTVTSQYARRNEIWRAKPDVLPDFEIDTLRCPLSAGLVDAAFADWFVALDAMCEEMSKRTFDVAIVGAGAWGVPLAVHAKKLGKKGIHLGGPTQLLFGILGGRWDSNSTLQPFFNDAWVRPGEADRPEKFRKIENGCYW
jgi:hypothetical protein